MRRRSRDAVHSAIWITMLVAAMAVIGVMVQVCAGCDYNGARAGRAEPAERRCEQMTERLAETLVMQGKLVFELMDKVLELAEWRCTHPTQRDTGFCRTWFCATYPGRCAEVSL
jgi:hypothetical protein